MCLFFCYTDPFPSPGRFKLILIMNRDEYFDRTTSPAEWEDGILCGRDTFCEIHGGGTWCGMNKKGRIGILTNIFEGQGAKHLASRGSLVTDYLKGFKSPMDYMKDITSSGTLYKPYNLILMEQNAKTGSYELFYLCTRTQCTDRLLATRDGPRKLTNNHSCLGNHFLRRPFLKTMAMDEEIMEFIEEHNTPKHWAKQSVLSRVEGCERVENRIYHGDPVERRNFSWMVNIHTRISQLITCSGSLITLNWVITSGHCVCDSKPSAISVYASDIDLCKEDIFEDRDASIQVTDVHCHYNFKEVLDKVFKNDIALLKLERRVNSPGIKLPCISNEMIHNDPSRKIEILGFGITESDEFNCRLNRATLSHIKNGTECFSSIQETVFKTLGNTTYCSVSALNEGYPCVGDSGGGLFVDQNLVGLISFGTYLETYPHCRGKFPTFYTKETPAVFEEPQDLITVFSFFLRVHFSFELCTNLYFLTTNKRVEKGLDSRRALTGYEMMTPSDYGWMKDLPSKFPLTAECQRAIKRTAKNIPWRKKKGKPNVYFLKCTGQIIAPKYVLTAAHCLTGYKEIKVLAGYFDARERMDPSKLIPVDKIIVHKDFREITKGHSSLAVNDIALMKVKFSFDFSDPEVGMACLPVVRSKPIDIQFKPGDRVTIMGFGVKENGKQSCCLRYAETVKTLNWRECLLNMKSTPYSDNDIIYLFGKAINKKTICTIGDDKTNCYCLRGRLWRWTLLYVIEIRWEIFHSGIDVLWMGYTRKIYLDISSQHPIIKHPWMVLILIQSPEGITQCSGQLIFASWVVTAAQCISRYSIETVKVIYGDYSSVKNESDIKFVYAESLFLHTKYLPIVFKDRKFHLNDLGLLKLALSINLRAHDVGIACLPVPKIFNDPYEPVFASMGHESIMKASLTKKNSSDSDSKDNITLSDYYCCPHFNAKLWKIGWKECIYEIFELFPKRHMLKKMMSIILTSKMSCVLYDKNVHNDQCFNDKGAGMYLRTSRRYLLVGILSFGPNETTICTSPSPIIYFNLEYYLYWIYLIKTNDIDRIRIQFPQERKKDLTTPPPQNTTTQSPIQNQYNLTL
ncbi:unnamed protein product [Lepeophtheirus salmonis]|uniref:(salmon louse) hypothetical protein n=1 Tax=Lepeophtheirus salmonis TaxID=72036 RepID=A0A7R8CH96_LEPSM|nr:unnamed protein product [Lepeophtheirus salmonis]CAF2783522.1 unnamed protein product [Lepeophtheirus salmonis]